MNTWCRLIVEILQKLLKIMQKSVNSRIIGRVPKHELKVLFRKKNFPQNYPKKVKRNDSFLTKIQRKRILPILTWFFQKRNIEWGNLFLAEIANLPHCNAIRTKKRVQNQQRRVTPQILQELTIVLYLTITLKKSANETIVKFAQNDVVSWLSHVLKSVLQNKFKRFASEQLRLDENAFLCITNWAMKFLFSYLRKSQL